MPEPLINRETIDHVKSSKVDLSGKGDHQNLVSQLKKSMKLIDKLSYRVLQYLLLHAQNVANVTGANHKLRNKYNFILALWQK